MSIYAVTFRAILQLWKIAPASPPVEKKIFRLIVTFLSQINRCLIILL